MDRQPHCWTKLDISTKLEFRVSFILKGRKSCDSFFTIKGGLKGVQVKCLFVFGIWAKNCEDPRSPEKTAARRQETENGIDCAFQEEPDFFHYNYY